MTNLGNEVAKKIVSLRKVFTQHPSYSQLEKEFTLLLDRRRAEQAEGVVFEGRGIAVIGQSGSGKTRAVGRLFSHTPGLIIDEPGTGRTEVVSFLVPAPATLKFVGSTALGAVGYPLQGRKTEMIIWDMVRQHLEARKTLFLHLDEAQDLLRNQSREAAQPVVRTLKSLMQTRTWPMCLILSGTPELKELINPDPQLARRMVPVEFPSLVPGIHTEHVLDLTCDYVDRAHLKIEQPLDRDFAARLIHSANRQFGTLIEIIIESIQATLLESAASITIQHFETAYERRSGCLGALNPFVAADFERIDTSRLLENEVPR